MHTNKNGYSCKFMLQLNFYYMKEIVSSSVEKTKKLGARIGKLLKKSSVVALSGEFGAGKTTLIKGIAKGLGVRETRYVNSPSFVIVKQYKGRFSVYHFDIHRIDKSSELETVGYEDFFYGDGVTLIEWADKIKELLPNEYLDIHLSIKDENSRLIELGGVGEDYKKLITRIN